MLREDFIIDSGLVIEAFKICYAIELHEVMVALVVHGQKNEMVIVVSGLFRCTPFGVDVEFAPRDGLDFGFTAGIVEIKNTEHVAVVCDGQSFHAEFLGFFNVFRDRCRSVGLEGIKRMS